MKIKSVIVTIKYSTTLNAEVNQSLTLDTIDGTEIDGDSSEVLEDINKHVQV